MDWNSTEICVQCTFWFRSVVAFGRLLITGTFFCDFGVIMILQVLFLCECDYQSFIYFLINKHIYSSREILRRLQANKTFVCTYKIFAFLCQSANISNINTHKI